MIPTPTDEIRAIRRALAAAAGNDIRRIAEEARQREREPGWTYVSLPARPPRREEGPAQAPQHTPAAVAVS